MIRSVEGAQDMRLKKKKKKMKENKGRQVVKPREAVCSSGIWNCNKTPEIFTLQKNGLCWVLGLGFPVQGL